MELLQLNLHLGGKVAKHTFRFGNSLEEGCIQCGQPAAYHMHWTEEDDKKDDKLMDTIEELEKLTKDMWVSGAIKPTLLKAITELREARSDVNPYSHILPRRIGVSTISMIWLEKLLNLPPDHYVDSIWQEGFDKYNRYFKITVIGPTCPQSLFGQKIPEVYITMHVKDSKQIESTIEKVNP